MKKNKYFNVKTVVDGLTFHSKKEAHRYVILKLLKTQGTVEDFELQVIYSFACGIKYILDFKVLWADGHVSYEDVKPFNKKGKVIKTAAYLLKKKLMKHEFGIEITEV